MLHAIHFNLYLQKELKYLKAYSQVSHNFCNWSPLKMMKNALYFTLKALFILRIFHFFWPFGHVEKWLVIYKLSDCEFESRWNHLIFSLNLLRVPTSSNLFLRIQATIECGFTLKRVRDVFVFIVCQVEGYRNVLKLSCRPFAFTSTLWKQQWKNEITSPGKEKTKKNKIQ